MIEKIFTKEIPNEATERWEQNVKNYLVNHKVENSFYNDFYLAKSNSNNPTPDNIGLIWVRNLLTDLEGKLSEGQKYVLLQSFDNFGDISTIDVVKLPKKMHRDIVKDYIKILNPNFEFNEDDLKVLIAGGHVKFSEDKLKFLSSSGDFGNIFSRYNVNNISAYLVAQAGLKTESEDINKGGEYINKVLDLMVQHKGKNEFYSKLVDFYIVDCLREHKNISPHILAPLVKMKAYDRAVRENLPLEQTLVQEITDGLSKELMMKGVAEK